MSRSILIRIIAGGIYLLRRSSLRDSNARFLVFTGTSGKTLARSAVSYALRKTNHTVISPPYGYTNELGIVLAALGIESVHLFSWSGLRRVITGHAPPDAYICIEIGADWREDTDWFLKRFQPYGVCITDVSKKEWTYTLSTIWNAKEKLIACVPQSGFVCWSAKNESIERIREMRFSDTRIQAEISSFATGGDDSFTYIEGGRDHVFRSRLAGYMPYTEAFGFAIETLKILDNVPAETTFFTDYEPPQERLAKTTLRSGARLIHDTYKAIPQCMDYVLNLALEKPAKKRIAVVSAMHPLFCNREAHYARMCERLALFDRVYVIGPPHVCAFIKKGLPDARVIGRMEEYARVADELETQIDQGTIVVIKGAGRYQLKRLVAQLCS